MKRLLALVFAVLAAPVAQAGAPVVNTIQTDRVPPYLFPLAGTPVPVGGSANATVILSHNTGGTSVVTFIGLLPGSDFQVTGGTCVQGVTQIASPIGNCTIDLQFTPTAAGTRTGTLQVDCAPFVPVGGLVITCDASPATVASIALSGLAELVASVSAPIPSLGRYEITALALLLFAMAAWTLRRKP